jgi:hypothetical protein
MDTVFEGDWNQQVNTSIRFRVRVRVRVKAIGENTGLLTPISL